MSGLVIGLGSRINKLRLVSGLVIGLGSGINKLRLVSGLVIGLGSGINNMFGVQFRASVLNGDRPWSIVTATGHTPWVG